MGIHVADRKTHWNYLLALEKDLESAARYIEFCEQNFAVFSIELAHLLLAASSEVDVVAKLLCQLVAPNPPRGNINEYKAALLPAIPELPNTEVFVARYGLSFSPWSNWNGEHNPFWWRSYNNVKHERDTYFHEATLKNALNALGALLIVTFHYYSRALAVPPGAVLSPKDAMLQLEPQSSLLRLSPSHYYDNLIV
ncbi:MAG: hypothetical protein KGZ69_05990 [Methylomonas sp.]|nr:hypothetical protein [Methylomonas sp.]